MPRRTIETSLIFLLFALLAAQLPPDVNETHYLTKAKHGWDPTWCSGDIFLSSSFSHGLFYFVFGWLNQFFSLPTIAWIGRIVTWLLLAFGWQRLASGVLKQSPGMPILSAALFLVLNKRMHLAGEWVVGGFEAKGLAYGFVLLALNCLVTKNDRWIWPFLGLACAFHVLVGGWATLAIAFAWAMVAWRQSPALTERWTAIKQMTRRLHLHWLSIACGLSLTLIGVLPPLVADLSATPELRAQANAIYVTERIAHHLWFADFSSVRIARFALLLIGLFVLQRWLTSHNGRSVQRWRAVYYFAIGSLIISFLGLMLSGLAENEGPLSSLSLSLLRFYWFRMADFAVPATIALGGTLILQQLTISTLWRCPQRGKPVLARAAYAAAITTIIVLFAGQAYSRHQDPRPKADQARLPAYPDDNLRTMQTYQNWRRVCDWIRSNTPLDAVFITPDKQQTFKWYAQRSEVVNWKDVPQDAQAMVQWRLRASLFVQPQQDYWQGLLAYSDQQLIRLARSYDATHLLIPQAHFDLRQGSSELIQIYPVDPTSRSTYVVLELPPD